MLGDGRCWGPLGGGGATVRQAPDAAAPEVLGLAVVAPALVRAPVLVLPAAAAAGDCQDDADREPCSAHAYEENQIASAREAETLRDPRSGSPQKG